jgi:hypothetical protein
MDLDNLPVGITDWSEVTASVHPGESGSVTMRRCHFGDIRLRLVDYSSNYVADCWCHKGHIVFVVAGQLVIEHQHGVSYKLTPGTSYHVADDEGPRIALFPKTERQSSSLIDRFFKLALEYTGHVELNPRP